MSHHASHHQGHSRARSLSSAQEPAVLACEQIADVALIGLITVVPLVLGGRHDLGRLVLIVFAGVAGVAWFIRQALLGEGCWYRTRAVWFAGACLLLPLFQLLPLAPDWLARLAPRNLQILPFWTNQDAGLTALSGWNTISLTPTSTRLGIATLLAYVLVFFTAVQRLQTYEDIRKLLKLISLSVVGMAALGIVQYLTSNGKFLWFWEVPFTNTRFPVKGSFTCRNHFADFLVLGLGPLLATIYFCRVQPARRQRGSHRRRSAISPLLESFFWYVGLVLLVLAVLMTLSRGGSLALCVAAGLLVAVFLRHKLFSTIHLYGVIFFLVGLTCLLSTDTYERLASRLGSLVSGSLEELDAHEGRRRVWAANVEAIRAGGLFGSGVGSHSEIYPQYLEEPLRMEGLSREYTHAENSYLQIATENGIVGCLLIVCGLSFVAIWCWRAWAHAQNAEQIALVAAVAAGLLASAAHAVVDFVWFVPACMALVVLLAACALRLAQLSQPEKSPASTFNQPTWIALASCAAVMATWSVGTTWGPGTAALDWDRYHLISVQTRTQAFKQLQKTDASLTYGTSVESQNVKAMIFHLQNVLSKSPADAQAHLRLAGLYLHEFEEHQYQSQNAMSVDQIRAAAMGANFQSATELRDWLVTAFGPESKLLYQAYAQVCQALRLCPLEAKGYLYLANLCFLQGRGPETMAALVDQGASLRPFDGNVQFDVGQHHSIQGNEQQAIAAFQRAYSADGNSRLSVIRLLAGRIPVQAFIDYFQPDWLSLQKVWETYQAAGAGAEMQVLADYAGEIAVRDSSQHTPFKQGRILMTLAKMQEALGDLAAAERSLETAFQVSPDSYYVRRNLARILLAAGHPSQAIVHFKWCLARRPNDNQLRREYVTASQQVDLANTQLARYPTQQR